LASKQQRGKRWPALTQLTQYIEDFLVIAGLPAEQPLADTAAPSAASSSSVVPAVTAPPQPKIVKGKEAKKLVDQLKELAELKQQGHLTDVEYHAAVAQMLSLPQ